MLDDRTVAARPTTPAAARSSGRRRPTASPGPPTSATRPATPSPGRYAAPARREDLAGLPPAWIGVGDLDLFHDEDLDYARRLREAGVRCRPRVEPGMYHGAEIELHATVASMRAFQQAMFDALRQGLSATG